MFILNAEYELFYKLEFGESHLDEGKPFSIQDTPQCKSMILFTNPNDAPEDEVALFCDPSGGWHNDGWEWLITAFFPPRSSLSGQFNSRSKWLMVCYHPYSA